MARPGVRVFEHRAPIVFPSLLSARDKAKILICFSFSREIKIVEGNLFTAHVKPAEGLKAW